MLDKWQQQQPPEAEAAGDQTAVVAALSFWDYSLLYDGTAGEAYKATGRCFSVAAGRISYVYRLKGTMPRVLSFFVFIVSTLPCLPHI